MNLPVLINFLSISAALVAIVFFYRQLSPNLQIKITPIWIDKDDGILCIRADVKNISKVRIYKDHALFQLLEYDFSQIPNLSEFLPFTKKRNDERVEQPIEWRDAVKILEDTKHISPDEEIIVERIARIKNHKEVIVHVGVQLRARGRWEVTNRYLGWGDRWTRARYVFPPHMISQSATVTPA